MCTGTVDMRDFVAVAAGLAVPQGIICRVMQAVSICTPRESKVAKWLPRPG